MDVTRMFSLSRTGCLRELSSVTRRPPCRKDRVVRTEASADSKAEFRDSWPERLVKATPDVVQPSVPSNPADGCTCEYRLRHSVAPGCALLFRDWPEFRTMPGRGPRQWEQR